MAQQAAHELAIENKYSEIDLYLEEVFVKIKVKKIHFLLLLAVKPLSLLR